MLDKVAKLKLIHGNPLYKPMENTKNQKFDQNVL